MRILDFAPQHIISAQHHCPMGDCLYRLGTPSITCGGEECLQQLCALIRLHWAWLGIVLDICGTQVNSQVAPGVESVPVYECLVGPFAFLVAKEQVAGAVVNKASRADVETLHMMPLATVDHHCSSVA